LATVCVDTVLAGKRHDSGGWMTVLGSVTE
jgi:hypothetical protein